MLGYRIKNEEKRNHRAENYSVLCKEIMKLPVHRRGLPGKEISFILCPLTPPIPP
jgi:hypothetical protein